MKKIPLFCALMLFSLTSLAALLPISTNPDTIITDMAEISKLFPRKEGSPLEGRLIEFITQTLDTEGISYTETGFQDAGGYHSFSRIIDAELPGEKPDTLIIAVPLDTSENTGTGALNIAMAMGFLREMKNYSLPVSLRVLFFGAQEGEGPEYPMGSRHFLSTFYPDDPVAILYLNLRDAPGNIQLEIGGRGVITPRWLVERTTQALNKTALDYTVASQKAIFFRLGYGDPGGVLDDFLALGYPAIQLQSGGAPGEGTSLRGWIQSFFFFLSDFLEGTRDGLPVENETNYQFIRWRGNTYLVPEGLYISLLIIVPAALLFYPFFARRRFKRYLRLILRHLWIIPVVMVLVFLYLLLGSLLIELILKVQNAPDLWEKYPLLFFLLKIAGALTLYWVTHRIFRLFPFSRKGNFYSATALILLLTAFFVVAGVIISLSHMLLWSFFFAFLFTVFRNRYAKLTCLLLSMVWLLSFGFSILTQPQLDLSRFILFSHFKGNSFLALLMVPYIFLVIRLSFLFGTHSKTLRRWISRSLLVVLAAASAFISVFLLTVPPYGKNEIQPVYVTDTVFPADHRRTVGLESPAPFRISPIEYGGFFIPVDPAERSREFFPDSIPPGPDHRLESSLFLDQQEWSITVNPSEDLPPPDRVRLFLEPKPSEVLVILDANFPYSTDSRTGAVLFHIGVSPPLPLTIQFVLPQGTGVSGRIELQHNFEELYQPPPGTASPRRTDTYSLETRRIFSYPFRLSGGAEAGMR